MTERILTVPHYLTAFAAAAAPAWRVLSWRRFRRRRRLAFRPVPPMRLRPPSHARRGARNAAPALRPSPEMTRRPVFDVAAVVSLVLCVVSGRVGRGALGVEHHDQPQAVVGGPPTSSPPAEGCDSNASGRQLLLAQGRSRALGYDLRDRRVRSRQRRSRIGRTHRPTRRSRRPHRRVRRSAKVIRRGGDGPQDVHSPPPTRPAPAGKVPGILLSRTPPHPTAQGSWLYLSI